MVEEHIILGVVFFWVCVFWEGGGTTMYANRSSRRMGLDRSKDPTSMLLPSQSTGQEGNNTNHNMHGIKANTRHCSDTRSKIARDRTGELISKDGCDGPLPQNEWEVVAISSGDQTILEGCAYHVRCCYGLALVVWTHKLSWLHISALAVANLWKARRGGTHK